MIDDIIMSYWSKGYAQKMSEANFYSWKLAMLLAKKNYGAVHLVTDRAGYEALGSLPWSTVEITLDDVPSQFSIAWSLGKIHAIQLAVRRGRPFLHIDGDVFLWKRLPDWAMTSGIIVQCPEDLRIHAHSYRIKSYRRGMAVVPPEMRLELACAYNNGIVGGCDLEFWAYYCQTVLNMVYEPKNLAWWLTRPIDAATVVEQWMVGACAKVKGRTVTTLLSLENTGKDAIQHFYTHLIRYKQFPDVMARIRDRVEFEPYRLDPNEP